MKVQVAWRSAMGALSQSGLMLDERALRSVAPALDQLYLVFNEVCHCVSTMTPHEAMFTEQECPSPLRRYICKHLKASSD